MERPISTAGGMEKPIPTTGGMEGVEETLQITPTSKRKQKEREEREDAGEADHKRKREG